MGDISESIEGSDNEINHLFPKCKPKLSPIRISSPSFLPNDQHSPTPSIKSLKFASDITSGICENNELSVSNLNCVHECDANDNYNSVISVEIKDECLVENEDIVNTENARIESPVPQVVNQHVRNNGGVGSSGSSSSSSSSGRMSVDSGTASSTPASHSGSLQLESAKLDQAEEDVDVSVVSAYNEYEEKYQPSIFDTSYEDNIYTNIPSTILPVNNPKKEYCYLRDSRIEAAGGRELFSQSRSRSSRRKHDDIHRLYSSHHFSSHSLVNNVEQAQREPVLNIINTTCGNSTSVNNLLRLPVRNINKPCEQLENINEGSHCKVDSPLVYETCVTGSSEVVFDDIGDWVESGLTVKGPGESSIEAQKFPHINNLKISNIFENSTAFSEESTSVEESPGRVKKIGNIPIAEYEGSPRRYGPRYISCNNRLVHYNQQSQSHPPRPGFPCRIFTPDDANVKLANGINNLESHISVSLPLTYSGLCVQNNSNKSDDKSKDFVPWLECPSDNNSDKDNDLSLPHTIAISTLTASYASKLCNNTHLPSKSNTVGVINGSSVENQAYDYNCEVSETKKVLEEFFRESSELKLQKQDFYDLDYQLKRQHGNSYVGQRLAAECDADYGLHETGASNNKYSKQFLDNSVSREIPQNAMNSTQDEVVGVNGEEARSFSDCEIEHSRNFTLSPDTTSCDSAEVESEYSNGDGEGSVHSSSKGMCSTMPILEDGLSSGDESDMEECIHEKHVLQQCNSEYSIRESAYPSFCRGRSFDDQLCRGELPFSTSPQLPMSIPPEAASSPHSAKYHFNKHGAELIALNSNTNQSPSSSTLSLMKKQISEIEKEIALRKPDGSFRHGGSLDFDGNNILPTSLDLHLLDPLNEKTAEPPPPPAPHPHRGNSISLASPTNLYDCSIDVSTSGHSNAVSSSRIVTTFHSPSLSSGSVASSHVVSSQGSLLHSGSVVPSMVLGHPATHDLPINTVPNLPQSRESVEAAIADIKQAIRRTKSLSLKIQPADHSPSGDKDPIWIPRSSTRDDGLSSSPSANQPESPLLTESPSMRRSPERQNEEEDGDTDQETDRLLGQQRMDDSGFFDPKSWSRSMPHNSGSPTAAGCDPPDLTTSNDASSLDAASPTQDASKGYKKETNSSKKKGRSKEVMVHEPAVLIEGVLFRARYLGSTQLVSEGQPTKTTRMMQAEEAVSRIKGNGDVTSCSTPSPHHHLEADGDYNEDMSLEDNAAASPEHQPKVIPFPKLGPLTRGSRKEITTNPLQFHNPYSWNVANAANDRQLSELATAVSNFQTDVLEEHVDDEEVFKVSIGKPYNIVDRRDSTSMMESDLSQISPIGSGLGNHVSSPVESCYENESTLNGNKLPTVEEECILDEDSLNDSGETEEYDDSKAVGNHAWIVEGGKGVGASGTVYHLRFIGSLEVAEEFYKDRSDGTRRRRQKKDMVLEAVSRLKAPDGESQPSTEVDLFISTEKIMVLNTDLKEIMMDHALRTISYIADIGDLVVLMARRRVLPSEESLISAQKTPKMICHVFESDEAQFIAQSIGQAFQVAYLEFLKANGIEDHSFVKEMDYQEVLNSQEIFGDELQMFAKKELQKEVVVPKVKGEILGVVVVESGWGSMVPTVVIANLAPCGAAAKCGMLNIGDQIIAINGVSLVGLPLSTCQNYIKNTKYSTAVKLTVVPCPPVVEVKIRRPDTKYQLGFSVQNGVICSLLRGGIAERGGVRVGHRIIDINSQSVVAVPHEKIVNLLATSVGEIRMKTMPTSIFRLLTGQETPQYI